MTKAEFLSVRLSRSEQLYGLCYLLFQALFLPRLLDYVCLFLPIQLTATHRNLLLLSINLLAAALILNQYILSFFPISGRKLLKIVGIAAVGFFLCWGMRIAMGYLVTQLWPGYINKNDQAITGMVETNYPLMFVGTVFFAPITEECFFRGVLFRGFYDRSPAAAWLISICAFSALHIIGHTASLTWESMVLSFLQYLPAGLCLAGSYYLSGSLLCPVLIHAATNLVGMLTLR